MNMDETPSFPFLLLLLLPFFFLYIFYNRRSSSPAAPPGPPRLPVIGNLHQLGALPHRALHRLAGKHGPLMLLHLGQVPTLVVSASGTAAEVLKTHDQAFCSRPALTAWKRLSYGCKDLAFAPYDEYWRQMRRFSMKELFNSGRVKRLRHVREEEVAALVCTVARPAERGGGVNLGEMFLCLTSNVTCKEVFGKRFSGDGDCARSEFQELIKETISLMGGFCLGDFFPSFTWLNRLTGIHDRIERNFGDMDKFLEREIKAKIDEGFEGCDDFASVLLRNVGDPSLEIPLSRDHIKAILMVTFIAGSDTAAVSMTWAWTELMRHPKILHKAQVEVRRLVGDKGKVEETDLSCLHYLSCVIKETLRLHPPGPLLLPRETMEARVISGYLIPAKTRLYVNAWAIGRDPGVWEDPEEFRPERFEEVGVDYKGQHFDLVPFGGGRRICPGMGMAVLTLGLVLANLLYCFDWKLPEGMKREEIDMSEEFGIVVNKKKPLLVEAKVASKITC